MSNQGFGTKALHAGQTPDPTTGSRAVPLYQTTSFVFRDTREFVWGQSARCYF